MKLKELRKQNNKTQTDIANYLKVATNTYCWYEKEKSEPNIETLCKLADYYNVSLDYLVGRNFGNELGYLTKSQFETIKIFLALNEINQSKASGYMLSMLENQN